MTWWVSKDIAAPHRVVVLVAGVPLGLGFVPEGETAEITMEPHWINAARTGRYT